MATAGCCINTVMILSPGLQKRSGTLSSMVNGIQRQDSKIHLRSSLASRSAKIGCFNSLQLQAEPLEKGTVYEDPNGSGKVCIYHGITNYSGTKNRFGKELWEMKDIIKKSGSYFQGPDGEDMKRICLAVAMSEDTLMAAHDPLKMGLAANHSIYNLSSDMLLNGGFSGNLDALDFPYKDPKTLDHLPDATNCLLSYLHGWAPYNFPKNNQPAATSALNFVRGGRTSYNDGGNQWLISIYRRAIQTIVMEMERDFNLMGDGRRVEIEVPYI